MKLEDLKREHFIVWANGVTRIVDPDVFLSIARGDIRFEIEERMSPPKYPLKVRRDHYTASQLMWTQGVAAAIRTLLFPEFGTRNLSALCMDTASIVDPWVTKGVLVMTKPGDNPSQQDLYWADDPWFMANRAYLLK